MKKLFFLTVCLLAGLVVLQAQEVRLNAYSNYVFDDKFETYNSDVSFFNGTINGGWQWGTGIEYLASPYYGLEVMYFRQDTKVPVEYYLTKRDIEASVNYIMLGGVRYAGNDRAQGYGGLMLGMVIYDNKDPILDEPNSLTKFAWGVGLGGNIWATEKVGIKLQTHLLSGVQAVGGSFYFGTGGSGAGVSTFSTLFQFSLGGGLTFRFGE